ncbi:hypothetical protein PF007_g11587 [Phytophthora fragariae]|uniref:Uncharacterized protein n=1 Tax=Phytophthora fragariae TaxID=53985 RepID=A0A6A3S6Y8_9STRA|nr:hypothetical protein PF007_g11587 [Phytophthora fragariae]
MGYDLLAISPHGYIMLNDAPKDATAPMTAIGTGLGECFLTSGSEGQYPCFALRGLEHRFFPCRRDRDRTVQRDHGHARLRQAFLSWAHCVGPWPGHHGLVTNGGWRLTIYELLAGQSVCALVRKCAVK